MKALLIALAAVVAVGLLAGLFLQNSSQPVQVSQSPEDGALATLQGELLELDEGELEQELQELEELLLEQ